MTKFIRRQMRALTALLLLLAGISHASAWTAVQTTINGITYEATNYNGSTVIAVDPSLETVSIPQSYEYTYNNKTYTSTVKWLNFESETLKEMTVPESIEPATVSSFFSSGKIPNIEKLTICGRGTYEVYEGNAFLINSKGAVIECLVTTSDIKIPSTATSIGDNAFQGCTNITSIEISNSVTSIGDYAFQGCTSLTSITIPDSVKKIGKYAFQDCSALTSITIPDSVTAINQFTFKNCSGLTRIMFGNSVAIIGESAFAACSGLTSLTIPNSVTNIYNFAFAGCNGLTQTIIGNSIISCSGTAFANCDKLKKAAYPNKINNPFRNSGSSCTAITYPTDEAIIEDDFIFNNDKSYLYFAPITLSGDFEIPNTVTSIGFSAFRSCSDLTSITIPNSVTSIGDNAFQGCTSLTSITIPDSVKKIGKYAFQDCSALTSITIPDSVTAINLSTFKGCSGLTRIMFGNSVTSIGEYAFQNCSDLTSITIPNSVTTIGKSAFQDCNELTLIKCLGIIPPDIDSETFSYDTYENATLDIPDDAYDYFSPFWSQFNNITVDGNPARKFYDDVFNFILIDKPESKEAILARCNPNMTTVSIPDRIVDESSGDAVRYYVTAIGPGAFEGNVKLDSINTSRTKIKKIWKAAFKGCINLKSFTCYDALTFIDDQAFQGCTKLSKVSFNDALTSIGDQAFQGCTKLSEVSFNDALTSIGNQAFSYCGLHNIVFPQNLTDIGEGAFMHCTGMASVALNNQLSYIPDNAFFKCDNLIYIYIPNSVTSIGNSAFSGCLELSHVKIPNSVISIGNSAFLNSGLTSVSIPNSVTSIGLDAFSSCIKLKSFTIEDGIQPITLERSEIGVDEDNHFWDPIEYMYIGRQYTGRLLKYNDMTTLVIGNLLTKIDPYAFSNHDSLRFLTLGSGIETIGEHAFSDCSSLTSVVIPSKVTEIGASAFDGANLKNITIGAGLTTLGEHAFGCAATNTITNITAQTPPTASNNSFSNYNGTLYVQDETDNESTLDSYYESNYCWYRFNQAKLISATGIDKGASLPLIYQADTKQQLYATVVPNGASLKTVFWHSTNPEIATVDNNGLVTFHALKDENGRTLAPDRAKADAAECKIIASTLYADGPVLEFSVNSIVSKINDVVSVASSDEFDPSLPYKVYNLSGIMVGTDKDNLAAGIYIIIQGSKAHKIAVR